MARTFGVIFDMDGVLVDSYHAHYESWRRMAAEHGRTMTRAQFDATFGRTSREVIAVIWPELDGAADQIRALDDRKEALFREILAADFPPMPGARELLHQLRDAGVPVAVGSSGPPENVALVLDRLGARPLLAAVVTGSDVTRGKPDPEVFLIAARRMGMAPQRCVVVEDAPLGIDAAHAAGMAAVGLVSTGRTPVQLARADLVVRSLGELSPSTLRDLLGR
ncbi:MAG: HAD family phosphatase [Thermoguttaceae bacterium]|jgi:beta-phosphoglucomutase|nr:HAD family phosphatase [Thermoguttaceae bacterium]